MFQCVSWFRFHVPSIPYCIVVEVRHGCFQLNISTPLLTFHKHDLKYKSNYLIPTLFELPHCLPKWHDLNSYSLFQFHLPAFTMP